MQPQRLFEIVYLLMDRGTATTGELARKLEVFERTVRRDVDALSAAGVPVYMTRGKGGKHHIWRACGYRPAVRQIFFRRKSGIRGRAFSSSLAGIGAKADFPPFRASFSTSWHA